MEFASRTAAMVAAFRGRASALPEPLFCDPYAAALAGEEGLRYAEAFEQSFPSMLEWMAVRTAYIDAYLDRYVGAEGLEQVVVLGAGYDTRAARMAKEGVCFFEVDSPHSQRDKLHKLQQLPQYPVDAARYVACDFEQHDFVQELVKAGFALEKPAFIIWEGVSYYLSEEAVKATLSNVASRCHRGSLLIFDYVSKRLVQREVRPEDARTLDQLDDMGEPFRWGCNDILPVLFEAGFRCVRSCNFDEACLWLTQTYARSRMFRFQSFAVASPSKALDL